MNGTYWRAFGTSGTGEGQFRIPYSLTTANGYIYVVDYLNQRICKFNSMLGDEWETFGTDGTGEGQFKYPYYIQVAHDETISVMNNSGVTPQLIVFNGMGGTGWTVYDENIGWINH